MALRTPLKSVRGLGSAKEGADHFWMQRLTALANLVLVSLAMILIAKLSGADHQTVAGTLANPMVTILLAMLILSGVVHMRLGMKVVIEDYVTGEAAKMAALVLNNFFAIFIGLASLLAVLKLSLGG